ncbi:MAG TPA: outer membrane beta-barrel protein [Chitinophagaceae bacterium]|nr:outer membrane beta-barrel protein [Chitinophagaceae bacterium]
MKNFIIKAGVIIISLFIYHDVTAQTEIHGSVIDHNNRPVLNANILLLKNADSSLVKGMFTNEAGQFSFQNIPVGTYIVTSTYTGYSPVYTSSFEVKARENIDLGNITLMQGNAQLTEVKVAAKKPLLEQKIDRLVINVSNSITAAGNTALEILERSPGVTVDHQNNLISMNGKDGVVLIINGKMSHIPVSAVVQLLAGMPSSNIEKIELITTPPANFDAEGNAGYINIVLKENNNFGTNGSYSASLGYGKGWVEQASININHRKGKINLYGDVSYSRIKKPFPIKSYSRVSYLGNITETQFTGHRNDTTIGFSARLGVDYQFNSRTIIGVLLSNNDRKYTQSESNESLIIINNNPDTIIKLNNNELNHWQNYSANLNLQHNFKEDEKLSLNLDYIYYSNYQPVNYATSYYNNSGNFFYERLTRSGKSTPINFLVAAIDYSKKLSNKMSMETGIKTTFSAFNNDISFDRYQQQFWVKDKLLSAKYKLNEDYEAAYTSLNITINKNTAAKVGLRYEYTNSNLGTETIKNIVDRHYGKLFPTLFISHTINENNAISFSYSLRITRPTFTDLAPFTYYTDPNTLLTGNASLQPALSTTFKADYTYRKYLLSVSYSKTNNAITGFQPNVDSATNKRTLSPANLKNQKIASAIISIPITIGDWWTMQYNFTGFWQQINTFYKENPIRLSHLYYTINASQSFKLPKNFSTELSGFFFSPQLYGIVLRRAFGKLDLGIKKKLADKKSTLSFNVSDIFETMLFGGSTNLPEQNLVSNRLIRFSQRTYKLNFTHNFGNDKLKSKRDRGTGAEEEKGRVQY